MWLQWQLERAARDARAAAAATSSATSPSASTPVALMRGCGSTCSRSDARVGAPPDGFNEDGQDWGLPPFVPWKLRAAHFEPFIKTVRAAMRGVRGLRVDHVMGLYRLFWIPPGGSPKTGAYVHLPARELLDLLALESERAGAFVIGEDLGTVEDEVREDLAERGSPQLPADLVRGPRTRALPRAGAGRSDDARPADARRRVDGFRPRGPEAHRQDGERIGRDVVQVAARDASQGSVPTPNSTASPSPRTARSRTRRPSSSPAPSTTRSR